MLLFWGLISFHGGMKVLDCWFQSFTMFFRKHLNLNCFPSSSTPVFLSFGPFLKILKIFCCCSLYGRLVFSAGFESFVIQRGLVPVVGRDRWILGCFLLGYFQLSASTSLSIKIMLIEIQEETTSFQFLTPWATTILQVSVGIWLILATFVRFCSLCEVDTSLFGLVALPLHPLPPCLVYPLQKTFFSSWFLLPLWNLDSTLVVRNRSEFEIELWDQTGLTQESVKSLGSLSFQRTESKRKRFSVDLLACHSEIKRLSCNTTCLSHPPSFTFLRQISPSAGPSRDLKTVCTLIRSNFLARTQLHPGSCQMVRVFLDCNCHNVFSDNRIDKQPHWIGYKKLLLLAHFRDHIIWHVFGIVFTLRPLWTLRFVLYVHYVFSFFVCSWFIRISRSSSVGPRLRSFSFCLFTFMRDVILGHFQRLQCFFRKSTTISLLGLLSRPGFLCSWYGWTFNPTYNSNGRLLLWVAGRDGLYFKVHGFGFVVFHLLGLTEKKRQSNYGKRFYGFRSAIMSSEGKQVSFSGNLQSCNCRLYCCAVTSCFK